MKASSIFLVVFLIICMGFARDRDILVKVVGHKDNPPTVSIYSLYKQEQCLDAPVAEASNILQNVLQPNGQIDVYILIQQYYDDESLWKLLEGLKKNSSASLSYLERAYFLANDGKVLSKSGRELQERFETPEYTKQVTHP